MPGNKAASHEEWLKARLELLDAPGHRWVVIQRVDTFLSREAHIIHLYQIVMDILAVVLYIA